MLIMLQAGKASLSANAPACVAVWGWEELAGCVRRRAPPLACGIAPDPGDWKGKRMGGSSVYQMFCFWALRRRPCLWTPRRCGQYHNRSSRTITRSVIQYQLVVSRFPSLWVSGMIDAVLLRKLHELRQTVRRRQHLSKPNSLGWLLQKSQTDGSPSLKTHLSCATVPQICSFNNKTSFGNKQ